MEFLLVYFLFLLILFYLKVLFCYIEFNFIFVLKGYSGFEIMLF